MTGGTGFIGRALVRRLALEGHEVSVLSRRAGGDVADAAAVRRAAAGCEAIVHAAGPYRGGDDEIHRAHVVGTRNVVAAAEPGARVVLVSSTSVYGWEQQWPADHGSPVRPLTAYGRAKVEAERVVLAADRVDGVVARTTIVYGPGEDAGMVPRAQRLLLRGWRWFPGTGDNRIHLTHVDDLVDGLWRLLADGDGVYLFAGPRPTRVREVLGALAATLGAPAPVFVGRLPAAVLRAVPQLRHSTEVLTVDRAFDPWRAREELAWKPTVDLHEGMASLVAGGGAPPSQLADEPGPPWREVVEHRDEGLGSVYERFVLADVVDDAVTRTGATSLLHAPAFGMTGVPGLDAVFQARHGLRVGLVDVSAARLEAVRRAWEEIGLAPPPVWSAPWPDTSSWEATVDPGRWDLVMSFAALWWCDDPVGVLRASARWADKGVLCAVPNRNVFWALRSRLWHEDMFRQLRLDVCEPAVLRAMAAEAGLRVEHEWLFDVPPFPDTAVSIKELLPFLFRGDRGEGGDDAWRWSVMPYLRGEDPELPERLRKVGVLEARLRGLPRRLLAHHRAYLLVHDRR